MSIHGRILENLLDPEQLVQFDALSEYNKYSDIFDPEDVPEEERRQTARLVADNILQRLASGMNGGEIQKSCCPTECHTDVSSCCG